MMTMGRCYLCRRALWVFYPSLVRVCLHCDFNFVHPSQQEGVEARAEGVG